MALTTAIEDRVACADWAGATDLDLERRELLRDLFATRPDVARDGSARAILEQLRARTDSSAAALNDTRRALSEAERQLQAAPGVVRAYERNTAGGPHRLTATAGE
ncbi:MAG: hypothetical protein ABI661_09140, partial [Gammaproteobacteria bacterium]